MSSINGAIKHIDFAKIGKFEDISVLVLGGKNVRTAITDEHLERNTDYWRYMAGESSQDTMPPIVRTHMLRGDVKGLIGFAVYDGTATIVISNEITSKQLGYVHYLVQMLGDEPFSTVTFTVKPKKHLKDFIFRRLV